MVIDQRFETSGVQVLFAHQIDQYTRIEIAAARSHDHSPGRRQTHAGVNGLTSFNGGEISGPTTALCVPSSSRIIHGTVAP